MNGHEVMDRAPVRPGHGIPAVGTRHGASKGRRPDGAAASGEPLVAGSRRKAGTRCDALRGDQRIPPGPWGPEGRGRVFRRAGRLDSASVVKRLSAVRGGEYACQRGLHITYGSAAPEP